MTAWNLVGRSLRYYWRSHVAMVLGVTTAVAVLGGALLVGVSVRQSLRALVERRLGATTHAVSSPRFFRETLGADASARAPGLRAAPLVAVAGTAHAESSGRRASGVQVYGVDARYFSFQGQSDPGLGAREALVSPALAADLGAAAGDTLLLRVERYEDVSPATLFGRRADLGRTLRLHVAKVSEEAEFSLRASQQDVRAVFVPLALLQRSLERAGQANTLLLAETPGSNDAGRAVRAAVQVEDLGLRVRELPGPRALAVESASALLDDSVSAQAAKTAGALTWPSSSALTYLANRIRRGDRVVPYSIVAGLETEALADLARTASVPPDGIVLNEWTAGDLGARLGDEITLEYFLWHEEGAIATESASFRVAAIVPLAGAAADPDLTPRYPGITDSLHLSDWDPPFPVDLKAIRPRDEDYWRDHRTTPKAFVPLARAQSLWGHRLGRVSSVRVVPPADMALDAAARSYREALARDLAAGGRGFVVEPVRDKGLRAASGSTDFGEYFTYFSFFLVVAALMLAATFFRLGVEQRVGEVGLLGALGFRARQVRGVLLREGLVLAAAGSLLGALAAAGYASLVLLALRTVWRGAVGTGELRLHVSAGPLLGAAAAGLLAAALVVATTLRGLRRGSIRSLLGGTLPESRPSPTRRPLTLALCAAALLAAGGLLVSGVLGRLPLAGAFFGAGAGVLAAGLLFAWHGLTARTHVPVRSLAGLGMRSATARPGRSVLCMALMAAATFVVVSLGAFQQQGEDVRDPHSGAGGYSLFAESLLPLAYPLATPEGRDALGLGPVPELDGVPVMRFRLRPGDDASCLNLYRARQPRILGAPPPFLHAGRFRFAGVEAKDPETRSNPWLALEQTLDDGAIPAVADQNSIEYVLHKSLGEDVAVETGHGPVRLRLVAGLSGSLFQSELVVSEANYLKMFPDDAGYRFFLFEAPPERTAALTTRLESGLADQGFDMSSSAVRLAAFHRVENTYLATFQALGGLGLLLGTIGFATVLLRNALERRREMALARAVGFRLDQLRTMVLAENLLLLFAGLGLGTIAAAIAVLPAAIERSGSLPLGLVAGLLLAVATTGVVASLVAVAVVGRFPLLASLRAD